MKDSTFAIVITLLILILGMWNAFDGKAIDELKTQVASQQVVIDKLNEEVGKTEDGKSLNRIDTYDLVAGVVIQSIKENNK